MKVVVPDEFYPVHIEGGDTFIVNAKYDRADFIKPLGHWMLKIYDDEKGLITLHVDEKTARQVIEYAFLPLCERDTIFQSEFDGYLRAQERLMDGWSDFTTPPDTLRPYGTTFDEPE